MVVKFSVRQLTVISINSLNWAYYAISSDLQAKSFIVLDLRLHCIFIKHIFWGLIILLQQYWIPVNVKQIRLFTYLVKQCILFWTIVYQDPRWKCFSSSISEFVAIESNSCNSCLITITNYLSYNYNFVVISFTLGGWPMNTHRCCSFPKF